MNKSSLLLCAICTSVLWLNTNAQAALVTVPGKFENVDGPHNNMIPFSSGSLFTQGAGMRYQQVYSSSEFGVGGIIDAIRFRLDEDLGASFATLDIDIQIDLSYAATTVATVSKTFANNIGAGLVTVLDTPRLSLSGTTAAGLNPFNIVIDVDNFFNYDPKMGDLLVDIRLRNNPITSLFDLVTSSPVTSRIYTLGPTSAVGDAEGVDAAVGTGLVTQFEIQAVPVPAAFWLFGSGLLSLIGIARRKA